MRSWHTKGCCNMVREDITPNNEANISKLIYRSIFSCITIYLTTDHLLVLGP